MLDDKSRPPWQEEHPRSFLPADSPVTGKSVVRDTPLVPLIPYFEPQAPENRKSRIEFLKDHIGDIVTVKLNDSSVYTGVLAETGLDFFSIVHRKNNRTILFDIYSVKTIKIYSPDKEKPHRLRP